MKVDVKKLPIALIIYKNKGSACIALHSCHSQFVPLFNLLIGMEFQLAVIIKIIDNTRRVQLAS